MDISSQFVNEVKSSFLLLLRFFERKQQISVTSMTKEDEIQNKKNQAAAPISLKTKLTKSLRAHSVGPLRFTEKASKQVQ